MVEDAAVAVVVKVLCPAPPQCNSKTMRMDQCQQLTQTKIMNISALQSSVL